MLPAVWWMTAARIPLSYCGLPHRSDSSAPHSARLMMAGGWPGIMTPDGGVQCVSAGACGGEMRIAEMFCAKGCSLEAGLYPKPSLVAGGAGAGWVGWRVERAGDRDLHGRGGADEHRIRAAGPLGGPAGRAFATRRAAVGRRGFVFGLIPGSPRAVGSFGAHPGGRAGEVAGERDQRKRCVLADLANRDAGAEPDQRLLGELGVAGRGGSGAPRCVSSRPPTKR